MSITSDDFRVTSSTPSGATIASDYVNDTHIQEVKINTGEAGADSILSNAAPLKIAYSNAASQTYMPVAGSTDGNTPVNVFITGGASLDVSNITILGGTIDQIEGGVSTDIRTMGAGVTFPVKPVAGVTFAVTGDVKLMASTANIGDVDVLTVAIPTYGVTSGGVTIDEDSTLARTTLPAGTFETGFRITNLGPSTVYIGATAATSLTAGSGALAHGYPLLKYGTIFIEASKSESIRCVIDGTGTADVRIFGS